MKTILIFGILFCATVFAANEYKQPNASIFYSTVTLPKLNTSGIVTNTSAGLLGTVGQVPVANGGTGQATATAAFDGLSPTTTSGDMIYYNGTHDARLALGSTNQLLSSNGTSPTWTSSPTVTNLNFTGKLQYSSTDWFIESGSSTSENFWLGQGSSTALTTGTGDTLITNGAANNSVTSGSNNVLIGNKVMPALSTGSYNLAIGWNIAPTGNGAQNMFLGSSIATVNGGGSGERNVGIGYAALGAIGGASSTQGAHNVSIGYNTCAGVSSGSGNTCIGYQADTSTTTGSNNTSIGNGAGPSATNLTNATAIGASASVGASNSIVLGQTATQTKVGIGVSSPSAMLHVEPASTATVGLLVQGAASTTADLLEGKNSAGTVLWSVDKDGYVNTQSLKLNGSISGTMTVSPAATTTSYSVILPSGQGASSTYLKNDGSGNLSWSAVTATSNPTTSGASEISDRAIIAHSADSTCSITKQSGSWLSSVSCSSTGIVTLNFAVSEFSDSPSCICTANPASGDGRTCNLVNQSGTSGAEIDTDVAGTLTNISFDVICQGPH